MSLKSSTTSISNAYSSKTPLGNRSTNPGEAIFDLDPVRIHIAPHSYGYTTVSFTPSSIATYGCQFEATLENLPANMVKQRSVGFELTGDGTLPRFSIVRPTVRNRTGQTLMLFKRTVVGNEDTQSLVLTNDGTLAAKVNFFLIDPDGSFRIRPAAATASLSSAGSNKNERVDGVVMKDNGSVSSVIIQPGSQAAFQVCFTSF
jgi:hydrocephalus-inducing protein